MRLSPAASPLICLLLVRTSLAPCSAIVGIINSSTASLARGQGVLQLQTHGVTWQSPAEKPSGLSQGPSTCADGPSEPGGCGHFTLLTRPSPEPRGLHPTWHPGGRRSLTAVSRPAQSRAACPCWWCWPHTRPQREARVHTIVSTVPCTRLCKVRSWKGEALLVPEGDPTCEGPLTGAGAGQTAALALPQSRWRGEEGRTVRAADPMAGRAPSLLRVWGPALGVGLFPEPATPPCP